MSSPIFVSDRLGFLRQLRDITGIKEGREFMNRYERLKELEAMKLRYEQFFRDSKEYDYVVLSKHPHKRLAVF